MGAWIIGHNSPGNLPYDPDAVATRDEACRALRDYMLNYADEDDAAYDEAFPFADTQDDVGTMTAHVGAVLRDDGPERFTEDVIEYRIPDNDDWPVVFFMQYTDDVEPDEEY